MRATPVLLAAICTLATAAGAGAITLDDTTHFQVKKTWTATSLGVPTPLGGLHFAAGGDTLYVIGGADTPAAQIYAIPVTRDPGTHEVTDLGLATASFGSGAPGPDSGLDAGIELGPAGTLFVAYFGTDPSTSALGERPGGPAGSEHQFTFASLAGLTFSPLRTDMDTSFGRLQISTGVSRDVFEIDLMPSATPGVFAPVGSPTLFAHLVGDAVEGIQYVPAGTFQSNLLYAAFAAGELRLLTIDPATGLAVDAGSGMPTLGTTNPIDGRFAHDLGTNGPIGLEFDGQTNDDLFVSTFTSGTPANTIIRVAGFASVFPTTTTTSTTTTTTTSTTTTTTTTTSTTTIPTTTTSTSPSTTTTSALASSSTTTSPPATSTTSTTTTSTTTSLPTTTTTTLGTTTTTSSTTTTTSTSTTLTLPSTTTSTTALAPTTTTLPAGCTQEPTFASVTCRLDELLAAVMGSHELHPRPAIRLASRLARARTLIDQAQQALAAGHRRAAKRALLAAARKLVAFRTMLRTSGAPASARSLLLAAAKPLLADLRALASGSN